MANTWTTLLDAVYPTGSVYYSTNSTSPASKFGGTWSQIQDAFVAAKGSSYITGTVAAYAGDKYMKLVQMPIHSHTTTIKAGSTHTLPLSVNVLTSAGYAWTNEAYNDLKYYQMIAQDGKSESKYWKDHQATSDELSCLEDSSPGDITRMTGGGAKLRSLLFCGVCLVQNCLKRVLNCLNFIAPKGVMSNG